MRPDVLKSTHNGVVDGSPATSRFLDLVKQLPANASAAAFDVGTNDGSFSKSLMDVMARCCPSITFWHTMIEPQPRYTQHLTDLAANPSYNAVFHAAVAGPHDGRNVTLHLGSNRQAASTIATNAHRYGHRHGHPRITVPTVNLARLLMHQHARLREHNALVAARDGIAREEVPSLLLLKMDIEGGEADLLSYLLVKEALCTLSHLRVEWHLNAMPEEQRLGIVALRLGLRDLITRGCRISGRPEHHVVVEDEEYRPLNFGKAVPGLIEEAVKHIERSTSKMAGESMHGSVPLGFLWNLTVLKLPAQGRTLFKTHDVNGTFFASRMHGSPRWS
jgi:FkbM family methyltransferase